MTREGCVCCPYPLLALPGFLAFCAMTFTFTAAFSCRFFEISASGDVSYRSIGLWTVETDSIYYYSDGEGYCEGWDVAYYSQNLSDYFDAPMKAARAFGMMSSILGFFAFILIMIPACVSFGDHNTYRNSIAAILVFLGVFTILDLVVLASDICQSADSCVLQWAGIVAIVASVLWFLCACLMVAAMKKPRQMRDDSDQAGAYEATTGIPAEAPVEERVIKTVQNADGSTTTTTTTTVTNADGSKTVTTSTETNAAEVAAAEVTPAEVTPAKEIP